MPSIYNKLIYNAKELNHIVILLREDFSMKMKRTAEIVLTIIGAVLYAISAAGGALLIWLQNNQDLVHDAVEEAEAQGADISMAELNDMLQGIGSSGWMLAIFSVIAMIVGIIAIVFLKGNKKPKPAGIMLIIIAVLSMILLGLGSWIIMLLYLIPGIMALARKPKQVIEA